MFSFAEEEEKEKALAAAKADKAKKEKQKGKKAKQKVSDSFHMGGLLSFNGNWTRLCHILLLHVCALLGKPGLECYGPSAASRLQRAQRCVKATIVQHEQITADTCRGGQCYVSS